MPIGESRRKIDQKALAQLSHKKNCNTTTDAPILHPTKSRQS